MSLHVLRSILRLTARLPKPLLVGVIAILAGSATVGAAMLYQTSVHPSTTVRPIVSSPATQQKATEKKSVNSTPTAKPSVTTPPTTNKAPNIPNPTASSSAPASKAAPPSPPASPAPQPPASASLYVNPDTPAASQAAAWATSRPADAAVMSRLASVPIAEWYGDWTSDVTGSTNSYVTQATNAAKMPVLVAYNIPERDCGSYSAGGATSYPAYASWIQAFANGIGGRRAIVVLEPDALAGMDCLTTSDQASRTAAIADAVNRLASTTHASIYLDAGNTTWQAPAIMAQRLTAANIASATGFSINVSNFYTTASNISYGNSISSQVGGKHYVIDTSRDGNGSNGEWCNPSGRALGDTPTLATGVALVDAYLWIKRPGESDGTCNGGPSAGTWWPDYALGLAHNAGW